MSFKVEWLKATKRVITSNGLGEIIACRNIPPAYTVEIDEPVAGDKTVFCEKGEVVVDSDFSLFKAINVQGRILGNAQNFPSWEECLNGLNQPFSQDETLIALNFQTKALRLNRPLHTVVYPYHLVGAYMDMYWPVDSETGGGLYKRLEGAKEAWEKIDRLDGTSGHILLYALFDFNKSQILARALFTTLKVIKKETWW